MARVGGADRAVHADVQLFPLLAEFGRDQYRRTLAAILPVASAARSTFWPCSSVPREHHRVEALHALEARDGFGGHGGVSVADMRRGIHVIERSGEVVFHRELFRYAKLASAIICFSGDAGSRERACGNLHTRARSGRRRTL